MSALDSQWTQVLIDLRTRFSFSHNHHHPISIPSSPLAHAQLILESNYKLINFLDLISYLFSKTKFISELNGLILISFSTNSLCILSFLIAWVWLEKFVSSQAMDPVKWWPYLHTFCHVFSIFWYIFRKFCLIFMCINVIHWLP